MPYWILTLLVLLQPDAPYADTYYATAVAIAHEAEARPLPGPDGVAHAAVLLVSLAWFESRFDQAARGDGGQSLGLYQVSKAFAPAGDLLDPERASAAARRLVGRSFHVCASYPWDERLGWYAAGGVGCGDERARRMSSHRMMLAARLLRDHPPPL